MSVDTERALVSVELRSSLELFVLCLGGLVMATDMTVVSVALASIRLDMHFSEASAVWVVNAYMATYGGSLLLSGRLADVFGHRKLFLLGISLFTLASLGCGAAMSTEQLVAARALQGVGGAIVTVVALALTSNLFEENGKRARALGLFAFACTLGSSAGLLLGGAVLAVLSWRWIFLINVPVGACLFALTRSLVPRGVSRPVREPLNIAGVVTLTASLFRSRNLVLANVVGILFSAAALAWVYISALYLQRVLVLTPMQAGLTILPANVLRAFTSLVIAPILILRFGLKRTLVLGMLMIGIGLIWLGSSPVKASVMLNIIPALLVLGLGIGAAYNCVLLGALNAASSDNSGIVSGIVHTAFTLGGALGLFVLAGVAAARTTNLLAAGVELPLALAGGYHAAYVLGAAFALLAAVVGGSFLNSTVPRHAS